MLVNINHAESYFDGSEEAVEHLQGLSIDLTDGRVYHKLNTNGLIHDNTNFTVINKSGIKTDVIIGSLDWLNELDLKEVREACEYSKTNNDIDEEDLIRLDDELDDDIDANDELDDYDKKRKAKR